MNKLDNLFDIIIFIEKSPDLSKIKKQVEYTKKNIIGYRKIYIVSDDVQVVENSISTKLNPRNSSTAHANISKMFIMIIEIMYDLIRQKRD